MLVKCSADAFAGDSPDDGSVQVVEPELREVTVPNPEWHRNCEANDVGPRHPLVSLADGEQLVGETTPSDCLGVVLLRLLARPDVGAFDREEDGALVIDNGVHEDVV